MLPQTKHNAADAGNGDAAAARANALAERLFWRGGTLEIGGGRRVIGGVWPDRASILAAKRALFDAVQAGTMRAVVDDTASFQGIESIPDAVDHMLSRNTVGKVVVRM
jgi:NADPH:quinone reductase-like Zn-dependent oxidoreductase